MDLELFINQLKFETFHTLKYFYLPALTPVVTMVTVTWLPVVTMVTVTWFLLLLYSTGRGLGPLKLYFTTADCVCYSRIIDTPSITIVEYCGAVLILMELIVSHNTDITHVQILI